MKDMHIVMICLFTMLLTAGCAHFRVFKPLDNDSIFMISTSTYGLVPVREGDSLTYCIRFNVAVDFEKAKELNYNLNQINTDTLRIELFNDQIWSEGEMVSGKGTLFSFSFIFKKNKNEKGSDKVIFDCFKDEYNLNLYIYDKSNNCRVYRYKTE